MIICTITIVSILMVTIVFFLIYDYGKERIFNHGYKQGKKDGIEQMLTEETIRLQKVLRETNIEKGLLEK